MGKIGENSRFNVSSTPYCISVNGMAVGAETDNGQAVLLFNSLEIAELAIESLRPRLENAEAVQINLSTFARAAIAIGHNFATIDFFGGRSMGVVDLREVIKKLQSPGISN